MAKGCHLLVDIKGVSKKVCENDKLLLQCIQDAALKNGANIINANRYRFGHHSPPGCSVFLLLDESHISLHTYAGEGLIALDIFTCGQGITFAPCMGQKILDYIIESLSNPKHSVKVYDRF